MGTADSTRRYVKDVLRPLAAIMLPCWVDKMLYGVGRHEMAQKPTKPSALEGCKVGHYLYNI